MATNPHPTTQRPRSKVARTGSVGPRLFVAIGGRTADLKSRSALHSRLPMIAVTPRLSADRRQPATIRMVVRRPNRGCAWQADGHRGQGSNPSSPRQVERGAPTPRRLISTPVAVHLLPSEKVANIAGRARLELLAQSFVSQKLCGFLLFAGQPVHAA